MPKPVAMWTLVALLCVFLCASAQAQGKGRLNLHHADETEWLLTDSGSITVFAGSVVFETETGLIYCDSAFWVPGNSAVLLGRVVVDDAEYRLTGDSVRYDMLSGQAVARGDYVELWSHRDSLFAVGTHAFYDRGREYFYMLERPTVYFNYPDSAAMIEVISDFVEYDALRGVAESEGNVKISSSDFSATADCAVMHPGLNTLDLFDNPVIVRRHSHISGRFIAVVTDGSKVRSVDVVDSAHAEFIEPTDATEAFFDKSILSGKRMMLYFDRGELRTVTCRGQAYSWYYPAHFPGREEIENTVSGDTIRLSIVQEQLQKVDVIGGAIGTYLSTKTLAQDTVITTVTDTIDYQARFISYQLLDSLIMLQQDAEAVSGDVELEAFRIQLSTKDRIIEAYSGQVGEDSLTFENMFQAELQPNQIPVVLKDKDQNLVGDYLRYSIDTEKGRIVTSKSQYETGYYYGNDLYRQNKSIYYLDQCRYTTCDAGEPHFHFYSRNLKLIQDNKLIAKPVVFYLGRLPILALPYYVFPLKKGRHSGILPFTFGNIERGERYVSNVGYYWAASDYWDWQGALDYYEDRSRLNFYSKVNYRKLYVFDGYVSGNWGRETALSSVYREFTDTRWTFSAAHNHQFAPSFNISASGKFQSDKDFYTDFSSDLNERLNRVVRSEVTFSKRFGKSVSLSGKVSHDDNLDLESRTDVLPSASLSLPAVKPFGSGSINDEGVLESHWYQNFIVTYRPSIINYSARSMKLERLDSTITSIDTLNDTAYQIDSVLYRSRKKYTRVDHSVTASLPGKIAKYIVFNPSFSYSENWVRIHETDQSLEAGIDASTDYRTYTYSAGASLGTNLYGTIYPNVGGLLGFRQTITPTVSYRYTPEVDRHPGISQYAGASARSTSRSQAMSISLDHLYQAKIKMGEGERTLQLVSINHDLSYDFERDTRKLSDMSSSYASNVLPSIRFYGSFAHTFYKSAAAAKPVLTEPRMTSFSCNAAVSLRGKRSIFDDLEPSLPRGVDSASQLVSRPAPAPIGGSGWNLSATYGFSEYNRGTPGYSRKSFLRFTLDFYLTATTRVSYSEAYDFTKDKTITSQVNIVKTIHCWTGEFHWVPTGSTKGWGFRLYVTAMPEVKIDNSQSSLNSGYFTTSR